MELVLKAREKETERTAWELWLTYDSEAKRKVPFSELLKKSKETKPQNNDKRSDEEIIQDAEHIIKLMKRSS